MASAAHASRLTPADVHVYRVCTVYRAQGLAPLTSRLGFRPSTYTSKLHKRLREEVDRRHVKTTKVGGAGPASLAAAPVLLER